MAAALNANLVAMHPMVRCELALGNLPDRTGFLDALRSMPQSPLVTDEELLVSIEAHGMFGRGIGYVDAHLVSSCLVSGFTLWTRDRRLAELARSAGVA